VNSTNFFMNKNTFLNLLIAVFSFIVSLFLGEIIIRATNPQQLVRSYWAPDEDVMSVFKPNAQYYEKYGLPLYAYHVNINQDGFRMQEDVNPRKELVICLGDSFVFGWGVEAEKSFFGIVSRAAKNSFDTIQLVNAGVGAYSTGHVYKYLKKLRRKMHISKAIYFVNNIDSLDNVNIDIDYRVFSFKRTHEGSIELKEEKVWSPIKRFLLTKTIYNWLNQHSHLFLFLKKHINYIQCIQCPETSPELVDADRQQLIVDVSLKLVSALADYCASQNIPLLVIWVPLAEELGSKKGTSAQKYSDRFKEELEKELFKSGNALFYDPSKQMDNIVNEMNYLPIPDLYFMNDGHFNELGNRIFAECIISVVEKFLKTER